MAQLALLYAVAAFLVTIFLLLALRQPAHAAGLIDHPGGRKDHAHATPLTGGIAVMLAFALVLLFGPELGSELWPLLVAAGAMVLIGAVDDAGHLAAGLRLLLQLVVAGFAVVVGGAVIPHLGDIFTTGRIDLFWLAIPFTLLCLTGFINAVNMMDGLDGLASGAMVMMLVWLLVVAGLGGVPDALPAPAILLGALLAFFVMNFPAMGLHPAVVFLGDSGSMSLALVIGWLAIDLTFAHGLEVPPMTLAWILALPVLDTVCVMLRRVLRRRSPTEPDREHVHHYLIWLGLSRMATSWVLIAASAIGGAIGVAGWLLGVPEWQLFVGFLALGLVHFALLEGVLARRYMRANAQREVE